MNTPTRPSLWRYFILCLTKNYATFSGTASRREFWGFYLFLFIFSFVFGMAGGVIFALGLPWGELSGMQDPEQIQTIISSHMAPFILIVQIVTMVFYPPIWGVTIRRLRDAGFSTAWGYGYIALAVISIINWAVLDRFQYEGGSITQFLGVLSSAYWLLLIILACFPSRPAEENTPE